MSRLVYAAANRLLLAKIYDEQDNEESLREEEGAPERASETKI